MWHCVWAWGAILITCCGGSFDCYTTAILSPNRFATEASTFYQRPPQQQQHNGWRSIRRRRRRGNDWRSESLQTWVDARSSHEMYAQHMGCHALPTSHLGCWTSWIDRRTFHHSNCKFGNNFNDHIVWRLLKKLDHFQNWKWVVKQPFFFWNNRFK